MTRSQYSMRRPSRAKLAATAYAAGVKAAAEGLGKDKCPYPSLGYMRDHWLMGWEEQPQAGLDRIICPE